jgi:hypothetical protein
MAPPIAFTIPFLFYRWIDPARHCHRLVHGGALVIAGRCTELIQAAEAR